MMSFFDTLSNLPLFKGVSRDTLAKTVGKYHFDFIKYEGGKAITECGSTCNSLIFILSGNALSSTTLSPAIRIEQTISQGSVISPEFLFGRSTDYPSDIKALDTVGTLQISKSEYLEMLASDPVFLLNYLNMISLRAQKCTERSVEIVSGKLSGQLALIVGFYTGPDSRNITITTDGDSSLSEAFHISEKELTTELKQLKENGIVEFDTHRIIITNRYALLSYNDKQ